MTRPNKPTTTPPGGTPEPPRTGTPPPAAPGGIDPAAFFAPRATPAPDPVEAAPPAGITLPDVTPAARPLPRGADDRAQRYYTRRGPFRYAGKDYGRCELIALQGTARNDDRLIGLGYVSVVPDDAETAVCGVCGREFLSDRFRRIHGDEAHASARAWDEDDPDAALDRTMKEVNRDFPVLGVELARA